MSEVPFVKLDEERIHQRARKVLSRLAFQKLSIRDQQIIADLEREEFLRQWG